MTAIAPIRKPPAEAIAQLERVVLEGNLATLNEGERVAYYARVCESLGLNPLTKPFEYITLNNKLVMYVTRSGTDQLRDIHGVSIPAVTYDRDDEQGVYIVIASATDRHGRSDSGMGVVSIAGLKGEALANAMMKAETKAKRRATLSICGLGWMDEVEALDRQAVEVAPRAALAEGIASRRAALTGQATAEAVGPGLQEGKPATPAPIEAASSEAPAEDVSHGEGTPSPSPSSTCDHRGVPYEATPDGLKCSRCGRVVAAYDGEVVPEPKPAPRGRRKAAEPKKPGDEGYGTARAHAVAAERGLDHDAVHRIAFDVLAAPPSVTDAASVELPADFTVSTLIEAQWAEVIAAILEAPIDDDEAEGFAGRMAQAAGIGEADNPWPEAEPLAAEMFGVDVDDLTPAQWREFGIRVYARNPLP
jgi:hypothetical protein